MFGFKRKKTTKAAAVAALGSVGAMVGGGVLGGLALVVAAPVAVGAAAFGIYKLLKKDSSAEE